MATSKTISRTGTVPALPEQLRSLLSSTQGFTSINPHLTADPHLSITPYGPADGIGSGFAFTGKDGTGTQTITAVGSDAIEYAIDMGRMGTSTQRIAFAPQADGTTVVRWSTTLILGANPMLRVFALFADRVLGPTLETGIRNLQANDWPSRATRDDADVRTLP